MEIWVLKATLLFYLGATGGFVLHLLWGRKPVLRGVAVALLAGGFGLHVIAIVGRAGLGGIFQLGSPHDKLSLLACLIAGTYLILQYLYSMTVIGALVSPFSFLLTLSAYIVYAGGDALPRDLPNAWIPAHVAPAFLGYAVFAVAFFISVIYLVEEQRLKQKRAIGWLRGVPSLERLDALNYRFVTWGFCLFTLGIVSGTVLSKIRTGSFWSWEPVQVLAIMTWLLYAALLHTRSVGWRGRRAAALTVVGFMLLLVSFIGLNLGAHNRALG